MPMGPTGAATAKPIRIPLRNKTKRINGFMPNCRLISIMVQEER
jgi:hypothetical protein